MREDLVERGGDRGEPGVVDEVVVDPLGRARRRHRPAAAPGAERRRRRTRGRQTDRGDQGRLEAELTGVEHRRGLRSLVSRSSGLAPTSGPTAGSGWVRLDVDSARCRHRQLVERAVDREGGDRVAEEVGARSTGYGAGLDHELARRGSVWRCRVPRAEVGLVATAADRRSVAVVGAVEDPVDHDRPPCPPIRAPSSTESRSSERSSRAPQRVEELAQAARRRSANTASSSGRREVRAPGVDDVSGVGAVDAVPEGTGERRGRDALVAEAVDRGSARAARPGGRSGTSSWKVRLRGLSRDRRSAGRPHFRRAWPRRSGCRKMMRLSRRLEERLDEQVLDRVRPAARRAADRMSPTSDWARSIRRPLSRKRHAVVPLEALGDDPRDRARSDA